MLCDSESVLEAAITAIALADIDSAAAFFSDNAEITIYAASQTILLGGTSSGKDSVRKRLRNILASFDIARFAPRTVLPCDDGFRTQIDYSFRHRASGQSLDGVMRVVAAIEDGVIVRWQEYQDGDRMEAFLRLVENEG